MTGLVQTSRTGSRMQLLASVSSIALLAAAYGGQAYAAGAGEQPVLWVDLGAHVEQMGGTADGIALPFNGVIPANGITGPLRGGPDLNSSFGGDTKFTFRPEDSNWVFSASVSYGRSTGKGKINQREALPTTVFTTYQTSFIRPGRDPRYRQYIKPAQLTANSITGQTASSESHTILDFSAGKDVGLGMFGRNGTSVVGLGVRFASFRSRLDASGIEGALDNGFMESFLTTHPNSSRTRFHTKESETWRTISGGAQISHEFKGVGPSLSWDASVPLSSHDGRDGGVSLDWGLNAALLFGKQKNKEQHQSASAYNCYGPICNTQHVQYAPHSAHASRTRNVTVPNLGGFIGASYRIGGVKASIGYRGDWFFGALDTGLATSRKEDRGFFGPFINIGIGIGN